MKLTKQDFEKLKVTNIDLYLNWINLYCEQFRVNTINRLLCFLPNILHESANFKFVKEILPKNNPEYVKKLGKYFGHGLIQLTGERNFKLFTDWCKQNIVGFKEDFIKNPELVATPQYAVLSAFWYWKANNLEKYADKGDFINVCSIINTGRIQNLKSPHKINGMEDRLKKYDLVKQMIKGWM